MGGPGRIVFSSYQDGWPHLYSVPESGGEALLLTPGPFEVEQPVLSADRTTLVFHANTGPDPFDIDRRHVARAAVDKAGIQVLTPGEGIETSPVLTGDGGTIAFFSATAARPAVLAVQLSAGGPVTLAGASLIPAGFPVDQLVAANR